jgi:large subunit ribosomal protein L14e
LSVTLGQVVISRAGRDAGKSFVIVNVIDNQFVEVADGDLRRLEKPKKKKIKHLNITDVTAEEILLKFKNSGKITNADIRKALANLKMQQNI